MTELWRELGGAKRNIFQRNFFCKMDETFADYYADFLAKYESTDVYYSVYAYDQPEINEAKLYGPVYFDFDGNIQDLDAYEKVKCDLLISAEWLHQTFFIPYDQFQIYFSGSKGFHMLIEPTVFGVTPCQDLNEIYKRLAECASQFSPNRTLDLKIYDRRRLFRIPNSINGKTGMFKIPLQLEALRKMSADEVYSLAGDQQDIEWPEIIENPAAAEVWQRFTQWARQQPIVVSREKKTLLSGEVKELLPCVKRALDEGVCEGGRNNAAVAISSSLAQAGYSQAAALDEMLCWNDRNTPPLPEVEVRSTCRSAYAMGDSGRGYGCRFYQDMDLCDSECPVAKSERK